MINQNILLEKGKTVVSTINIGSLSEALRGIFVLCMIIALFLGCGEQNLDDPKVREKIIAEAIDEAILQTRSTPSGEDLCYAPNQERPYNGWVKSSSKLYQFQNGKQHGTYISWYENGQKRSEGSYKEGWKEDMWTEWSMNGQIHGNGFYKKGLIENGGALKPQIESGKFDDRTREPLEPLVEETMQEATSESDN